MTQKMIRAGNSLAATIPRVYANELNYKVGTPINWEKTDRGLLLYTPQDTSKEPATIDPEVAKLIKKLSKKYSQVWQELAKL